LVLLPFRDTASVRARVPPKRVPPSAVGAVSMKFSTSPLGITSWEYYCIRVSSGLPKATALAVERLVVLRREAPTNP
jgi:hypothetical protein